MYSAHKLNKQGDNMQPWCTPFPIWNQSVVPRSVLTVASWPASRFLKKQVRWSGIPSLSEFSSLLWPTQWKALAEIKQKWTFCWNSCFFDDPISWKIFLFVVIHTIKGFGICNKWHTVHRVAKTQADWSEWTFILTMFYNLRGNSGLRNILVTGISLSQYVDTSEVICPVLTHNIIFSIPTLLRSYSSFH